MQKYFWRSSISNLSDWDKCLAAREIFSLAALVLWLLTHWGRNKMAAIFQTTFSNAFLWMIMYVIRLKFHWNLFLRVQWTISQHWLRWWLVADQVTSHYLNQWWPKMVTHICATRPQWVNTWGPNRMNDIVMEKFSNAFSWKQISVFQFKFHCGSFLSFQLTIRLHCLR